MSCTARSVGRGVILDPIVAALAPRKMRGVKVMMHPGVDDQRYGAYCASAPSHQAAARGDRPGIEFSDHDEGRNEHMAVG